MFSLFLDIFTCRDSPLRRLDPRAKLVAVLTLIMAIVLSTRPTFPLVCFAGAITSLLLLKIPRRVIIMRLLPPLGMVIPLMVVRALTHGEEAVFTQTILNWELVFYREGLDHGILIASRVLSAVSTIMILSISTPAHEIFHALLWFKFPQGWVEIATLLYRYTFTLLEQAENVAAAQKLRMGYSSIKKTFSSLGTLAGTVILGSIDQAERTHHAMMMRGYNGELLFSPMKKFKLADWTVLICMPLITTVLFLWLDRGVL